MCNNASQGQGTERLSGVMPDAQEEKGEGGCGAGQHQGTGLCEAVEGLQA